MVEGENICMCGCEEGTFTAIPPTPTLSTDSVPLTSFSLGLRAAGRMAILFPEHEGDFLPISITRKNGLQACTLSSLCMCVSVRVSLCSFVSPHVCLSLSLSL